MSADRVHHPYSPSTLQCREACPKYQPTQSENEASIMGTLQHNAVESDQDDDRIPDYKAMVVAQCKEYANSRIAAFGPGATVLREVYLPVDDEIVSLPGGAPLFRHTTAGYLDLGIVNVPQTHAEIIDWKFGKNAVSHAKENLQGIAYMLGVKKLFPGLETCTVRFFQPYLDDEPSSHTFDISNPDSYLLRIRTVVLRAVEAAEDPGDFSSARATVGTCLFCQLVGRCPKVAELVIQVGKKYAPLVVPADINTVSLEDPAMVSQGMKLAQVVKLWAESFRKNATQKAINDEDFIPEGYVLVPQQRLSIRKAKQVGEIAKRFLPPEHADKIEAMYDIALTPIDKLVELVAPRGMKEKTQEAFRQALVDEGAAEMGQSFSVLRMATDKDSGKTASR
jgi:hypothetical protein